MAIQKKRFTKGSVGQKNPEAILPAEVAGSSVVAGPASRPTVGHRSLYQRESKAVLMARNNGVTEKAVSLREPSWVLAEWL